MPCRGRYLFADIGFGQRRHLHLRLLWCSIVVGLELCCQLV